MRFPVWSYIVSTALLVPLPGCDSGPAGSDSCERWTLFVHRPSDQLGGFYPKYVCTTLDADYQDPVGGNCTLVGYDYEGENTYFQYLAGSQCTQEFDAQFVEGNRRYIYNGSFVRVIDQHQGFGLDEFARGTYSVVRGQETLETGEFDFYESFAAMPSNYQSMVPE